MKNFLSLVFISSIFTLSAMAQDMGTCKLKGKYHSTSMIILPWVNEKKTVRNITIGDCIREAKMLLDYEQLVVIDDCNPNGPCFDKEITVTISRVKYKFTSKKYKTKAVIKKRK